MSSKRLTGVERDLLKGMIVDGAPNKEIAETFGVSTSIVTYYAVRMGLSRVDAPRPIIDDEPKPETPPVLRLVPQGNWILQALCTEVDNEIFFPEKGGSTREAKSVCEQCPVAAECLDYALANNERFGIWGGLSERERRKLSAPADTVPCPVGCGVMLRTDISANRHAKAAHADVSCPSCGDTFANSGSLSLHSRAAHPAAS